jgi:hypothetical protein
LYPPNVRRSPPNKVARRPTLGRRQYFSWRPQRGDGRACEGRSRSWCGTPGRRREILIIGVWVDIHRPNNGRWRNPIAFGSHTLRINRVISRLQRAACSASIPTSHRTACD